MRNPATPFTLRLCSLCTLLAIAAQFPVSPANAFTLSNTVIVASRSEKSVHATTSVRYIYPSAPVRVLRGYAPPENRWQPGHRGVDLELAPGSHVRSAATGEIHFAGAINGQMSISVMHADGIRTTYGPLEPGSVSGKLNRGDKVKRGDVIGTLSTPTTQHPESGLHWGAIRGKDYLNPMDLVNRRAIVLKPASG